MATISVGAAIVRTLESPNEPDSNGENANVVDGLFYIGRALHRLAAAHENANRIATGQPFEEV